MNRHFFSALLFTSIVAALAVAAEMSDLVTVPVHYSDQAVVIATRKGVAIVRFTEPVSGGRKYTYRFLSAVAGSKEVSGEGQVFEKYEPKPGVPGEVIDAGGQLRILAGRISLQWSVGGDESGWLYFTPEEERVQLINADGAEKLDLRRFAIQPPATAPALQTQ